MTTETIKNGNKNDLLTLANEGYFSDKKEPLFKIVDEDNNMHEYIIYTNGTIEGFPGKPLIFNYFLRLCKKYI